MGLKSKPCGLNTGKQEGEETKGMDKLTVKTLNKAVEWIVNKSCEDICQICAYYNAGEQSEDEHEDPCIYHRNNGEKACRNGIIERFQSEVCNE